MATALTADAPTDPLDAFRQEARDWLAAHFPKALAHKDGGMSAVEGPHDPTPDEAAWTKAMGEKGWGVPTWPAQYGGGGLSRAEARVLQEEMARIGAWNPIGGMGVMMFGPTLLEYGTEAQKQEHIPAIARGEVRWCQGYSEPGAGSDLASLQTFAEDKGDHYLVNGQKTWTSFAHWGDWIFCLVGTNPDGKPQESISFLLIDMKTPGVTVRPIIMLDGAHHVNDVFLDNVKVPVANLIGKENEGWACAKFLLANERLGIAEVPSSKRGVRSLYELNDDPSFNEKIADLDLQVQALEMSELRALSTMALGGAPGPEVSTLKVRGSEIQQRIAELAMEAVGEYAAPYQPGMLFHDTNETPVGPDHAPPAAPRYFNMRKTSIYGGSTEIQKNIVSKMVLGL